MKVKLTFKPEADIMGQLLDGCKKTINGKGDITIILPGVDSLEVISDA